jgi:hypothetical protein
MRATLRVEVAPDELGKYQRLQIQNAAWVEKALARNSA